MSNLSYAIIGTGAIGGYYGACLQRAGNQVHFLLHSDYQHVQKHGLIIESPHGNFTLPQIQAYQDARSLPASDVVILALKTTHNHLLSQILPFVLKDSGVVLVLQNGLGVEEQVAQIVGSERVIGGLCFICSNKVGPGHIRHLDYGAITMAEYLPNYQPAGLTQRLEHLAALFEAAGIEIQLSIDLLLSRWQKLVWNIPYNGLSVVLNATTEQLMAVSEIRSLIEVIMGEVALGASTCHRQIEDSYLQKMLSFTAEMKPYRTSMKIDYDNRQPLEIEEIIANPLRVAAAARVDLPRIRMLYQQLKFLDSFNRQEKLNH